jgi:hypothetical protein
VQEQDGQPEQAVGRVQQQAGRVRQEVLGKFKEVLHFSYGMAIAFWHCFLWGGGGGHGEQCCGSRMFISYPGS